jgi:polar amino acid transport system substrate-binding protein
MRFVLIGLAAALLLAMAPGAMAASCVVPAPAELASAGKLTIGTTHMPPPPGMKPDPQAGVEYGLAAALAEALCLKPDYVALAFAGLFPALNAKKFDVAMAAIGISAERAQAYDFVPYFLGGLRLVVRKDSGLFFKEEIELCGHSVAMLAGSVEVQDLDKYKDKCPAGKPMDMRIFPSNPEVLEQLRKRTVEAIFIDWPPAAFVIAGNPQDFAFGSPILSGEPPGQPRRKRGIMLRKGDAAMKAALDKAMAALIADGTYDKILKEWGLSDGDVRNNG